MAKIKNSLGRNLKKIRSKDKISKQQRSGLMSKIRSKNTKFEQDFITELKKITKKKFSINVSEIRGKPDIVFKKNKICVFLDSDFWHGWQYPRWKHLLKNDFWRNKIEKTRERDKKTTRYLRKTGWKVLRYWEHQLKQNAISMLQDLVEKVK